MRSQYEPHLRAIYCPVGTRCDLFFSPARKSRSIRQKYQLLPFKRRRTSEANADYQHKNPKLVESCMKPDRIKNWPLRERPRKKLIKEGPLLQVFLEKVSYPALVIRTHLAVGKFVVEPKFGAGIVDQRSLQGLGLGKGNHGVGG
jgi:hypothetical protein